ncbi:SufE family protein [Rheinheimera riviphila]|uniref:SufE family protein n=1 Tax=Rheinheimera riviphila TaxID=1834037 RepID=A0A437R2W2_9GAMM|nr:SufE family protein [Rheinheimera riviphila]RVU41098.1 SufE family protein [Rheinheimera riviphila]
MSGLTLLMTETEQGLQQIKQQQLPTLTQTTDWQNKYRMLMQLGKGVPAFAAELQREEFLITGCDSKAWLLHEYHQPSGRHYWAFDSEARIIKGLVLLALCQLNGLTNVELSQINFSQLFALSGVQQNLSPSRQNGLHAVLKKLSQQAGLAH